MLLSQQRITPKIKDLFALASSDDEKVLRKYVVHDQIRWVSSAREGIRQILLQFQGKKVGVPGYTCHVVLDAVKRAGCEPVFYDSGLVAEVGDVKKIIEDVDILILSYNFGFLPEIDKIVKLCKENGVILIEDCAQALGARYGKKLVGGFGDYAVYSFGISKNVGFCGGIVAGKRELPKIKLRKYPLVKLVKTIIEVVISSLFFNKYIYTFSSKILNKELKKEYMCLPYECSSFAKRVVLNQMKRYAKTLNLRKRNGEYCVKELKGIMDLVKPANSDLAWLYFVFVVDDKEKFKRRLLGENVEIGEMLTFRCLDQKCKKSLESEKKVLTFALYRDFSEIKYIVEKIRKMQDEKNRMGS